MPLYNPFPNGSVGVIYDGAGTALNASGNTIVFITVPYNGNITEWDIFADTAGSIVIDVWKAPYASFPPTIANTITGTDLPTLSSAQKNQNTNITAWTTTTITTGDVIAFHINSTSVVSRVTLSLRVRRT